ncbi:hypothetical protein HDU83_003118 [Entophlyctis luteolus]|nr:hypothetical protein HDU83_003118 [Entophlyctis luteolus]
MPFKTVMTSAPPPSVATQSVLLSPPPIDRKNTQPTPPASPFTFSAKMAAAQPEFDEENSDVWLQPSVGLAPLPPIFKSIIKSNIQSPRNMSPRVTVSASTLFQTRLPPEIMQDIFARFDIKRIFSLRILCWYVNECVLDTQFAKLIVKRWALETDIPSCSQLWFSLPLTYKFATTELWRNGGLKRNELVNSDLAGEIRQDIGMLDFLNFLYVSGDRLFGAIPSQVQGLTQLKSLTIEKSRVSGTIPAVIGSLPNLERLILRSNRLSGGIPANLASLTRLEVLDLSENVLGGDMPEELWSLKLLKELRLDNNKLTGRLPNSIGGLQDLTILLLAHNQFSGPLPLSADGTSVLLQADLSHNSFEGPIPACWFKFKYLMKLDLSHNTLDGTIPPVGASASLVRLNLSYNKLTGDIPSSFGRLLDLVLLNLSNNRLTGGIPRDVELLLKLQVLDVSFNDLTHVIVPRLQMHSAKGEDDDAKENIDKTPLFFENANLVDIRLNNNRLSDPVALLSKAISRAEIFDISQNQFSGTLGELFGKDDAVEGDMAPKSLLKHLALGHNTFGGEVPQFLAKISTLNSVDLSFNRFVGSVPAFQDSVKVQLEGNLFNV